MRKSRFTEEQITMALRQAEVGTPVAEICRKLQVTEQTFCRWKKQFDGLGTPEIRELRQLVPPRNPVRLAPVAVAARLS